MFGAVNVLKSEEAEDSTESELDIFPRGRRGAAKVPANFISRSEGKLRFVALRRTTFYEAYEKFMKKVSLAYFLSITGAQ